MGMEKGKLPLTPLCYNTMSPSSLASSLASLSQVSNDSANLFIQEINRMPNFPTRDAGHRRAQSETITLSDDLTFDDDLGVVGPGDGAWFSDENEGEDLLAMYIEKFGTTCVLELKDSDGSDGAQIDGGGGGASSSFQSEHLRRGVDERFRFRHHHSLSMGGSTSEGPSSLAEARNSISAVKLEELTHVNPKRAKSLWSNRQSSAHSKERKMRRLMELERRAHTLEIEATTLSAELAMLERETNRLTAENHELKLRNEAMEHQVFLQDVMIEANKKELKRMRMARQQLRPSGTTINFGPPSFGDYQPFNHNNQDIQSLLEAQQLQLLQIHHQQQIPPHQRQQQQQAGPGLRASVAQNQMETTPGSSGAATE